MKRLTICILSLVIFISACVESSRWTRNDVNKKLKEIFPDAKAIRILDTVESKQVKTDTLDMPLPYYKALISEKDQSGYSFILFFYNVSLRDTSTFAKVFRATMIHDISAGLGNKKIEYVLGMPQFDKIGDKLIVYAASLDLPRSYDLAGKEKAIRKIFALQETKFENIKISDPKR